MARDSNLKIKLPVLLREALQAGKRRLMFYKFLKYCRFFIIYGLILILGLFLSFGTFLATSKKAAAKEKEVIAKTVAITKDRKTFEKEVPSEKKDVIPPIYSGVTGLNKDATYFPGQKIELHFSFEGADLVWAEINNLDSNFPQIKDLKLLGNNVWRLQTPVLSEDLNLGGQILKVYASDKAENIVSKNIKLVLKRATKPVVTFKSDIDNIVITWTKVDNAQEYLITWKIPGGTKEEKIVSAKFLTIQIKGLKQGTNYEIQVIALIKNQKIAFSRITIQTKGKAIIPEVASQADVCLKPIVIEPAIGRGVATRVEPQTRIAEIEPQVVTPEEETPATEPSPKPEEEEEETQAGGWNKLLVALSILIIAAGAAIGGYYGYEWLMLRSKDDEEPPESKSDNRW